MKNIKQLARIFSRFIELDSSFVLVEDIRAIRKHTSENTEKDGKTEVITPHGTFLDSTDFEVFKTRMNDALELIGDVNKLNFPQTPVGPTQGKLASLGNQLYPTEAPAQLAQLAQPAQAPSVAKPIQDREITLVLSGPGADGRLFDDPRSKVVNRQNIRVLSPDGSVVAGGTKTGSIIGENISGIVYETGKYRIAAKNYKGNKIIVRYQMQRR